MRSLSPGLRSTGLSMRPGAAVFGMAIFGGPFIGSLLFAYTFTLENQVAIWIERAVSVSVATLGVLGSAEKVALDDSTVCSRGLFRKKCVLRVSVSGVIVKVEPKKWGFWPHSTPWNGPRDFICVYLAVPAGLVFLRALTLSARGGRAIGGEPSSVVKARAISDFLQVPLEIDESHPLLQSGSLGPPA